MKTFIIAKNTFKEIIRDKVLYNILFFAILMIGASALLGRLSLGEQLKVIKDMGLACISLFGTLIAIFIGISLVFKEIDKKRYIQSLCPVNRTGTECIKIDEESKLLIDEITCIGCGLCVKPAPEAIKIINLPEELKTEPIYRYGENEFALFSLPTPLFGKVVGILGANGIGKSSAIGILAGLLKPNFGDLGKKADFREIID